MTEFGQYCCPDPANQGYAGQGVCSDGAGAAGATYNGTWRGQPASYNDAVLTEAAARNASWIAWAWVPGGVKVDGRDGAASCAYPMLNDGGTHLIGDAAGSAQLGAAPSGLAQFHMAAYGSARLCTAPHGSAWLCTAPHGSARFRMARHGSAPLQMAQHGST